MVMRVSVGQVLDQQAEKKEYFNTKYSFSKVTGLKEGMEVYVIPLNLENGLYQMARHRVKARAAKKGFKGWYDTSIVCKGVNEDGTKNEGALCCKLAQQEYDKHPDGNDYGKRMISFTSYLTYIPVLILGCIDSAKGALKYPPSKLSIKNYQFSYLEMASSSFNDDILTPFIAKLKDEGIVDYDAEGEDLKAVAMEQLQHTIIKVSANKSSKKNLPYERSFSFIPFSNQNIGKESDQYKYITNYSKIGKVNNDIVDFITLFDSEVDNLCKNWTDEELSNYINESDRSAKVEEAVKTAEMEQAMNNMFGSNKAEQIVTEKADDEIIGEEEIPFGEEPADEDDFGDLDEVDTPVSTDVVTEDFGSIDDSELGFDPGDAFFTEG